jgi:hypothetical protein
LNVDKKPTSYLSIRFDKKRATTDCDVVNLTDGGIKLRKLADIEETDGSFRWQMISSKFLFDYPIVFKTGPDSEKPIQQKVKVSLDIVEKHLETANILFNSTFR